MTPQEVANEMGASMSTVRKWIDRGILPAIRLGHYVRIEREDFEEMIRKAKMPPDQRGQFKIGYQETAGQGPEIDTRYHAPREDVA